MNINLNKLEDLMQYLDDGFSINSGGCCLVAAIIAGHLDRLNIKYHVVGFHYRKFSNRYVYTNIKYNRNKFPCRSKTCEHYAIKVGDKIINRSGFDKVSWEVYNIHSQDLNILYDNGYWNDEFDISDIGCVTKLINDFFRPYEKENN
jgi:hypothetical protein